MIKRASISLIVLFTISISYYIKGNYSTNSGDLKRDILIISTLPGNVCLNIQDPPTQSRSNKTKARNSTKVSSGTGQGTAGTTSTNQGGTTGVNSTQGSSDPGQGGADTTPTNQGGTTGEGSNQDSSGINKGEGSGTGTTEGTGTNSEKNYSILELQVEPDRKTIYSGEQTSIQIDLHELDSYGNEDLNCGGKEVDVKVTGIVDGSISHKSGKIKLNEVGVAFINYRAGQRDKQITISSIFALPSGGTGQNTSTNLPDQGGGTSGGEASQGTGAHGSGTGQNSSTSMPDQGGGVPSVGSSLGTEGTGSGTGQNTSTKPPDQGGGTSSGESSQGTGENPGVDQPGQGDSSAGNGSSQGTTSHGLGTGHNTGIGIPGYDVELRDEATITIKPLEYDATLTIKGNYRKIVKSSYRNQDSQGVEDGTFDLQESRDASFYVPLKMENAGDMPILNQRWEYYRPLDIDISNFNASFRSRQYAHGQHGGFGFRSTKIITKSPVNHKVAAKEYLMQSNIILIIDNKTDKVVKIATGGFPVSFKWIGSETSDNEGWSPDTRTSDHKSDPIDEDDVFDASPVEDPVPDPTFTSISSSLRTFLKDMGTPLPANIEIPEDKEAEVEVEPDLLVKFGDGATFFGGKGNKIIDNSKGSNIYREESDFSWHVTRKKKPL